MGEVNFNDYVHAIGLEELAGTPREDLAFNFMSAAITGLADGDLDITHSPYTGREAELYGQTRFADGSVAQTVLRTALENGSEPGIIRDFQHAAAAFVSEPGKIPYRATLAESPVRVHPEVVTIDGNPLILDRQPSVVVDYAACLTGRGFIFDQMHFLNRSLQAFLYAPLTRLHFTNQALLATYDTYYGSAFGQRLIAAQHYTGQEDGVAAGTAKLLESQSAQPPQMNQADIILCTGAHHTAADDLQAGIASAHQLLREGGMLIIRGVAHPGSDELSTSELVAYALDAGFDERRAIRYDPVLNKLGSLAIAGHHKNRQTQAVVLTK